MATRTDAPGYAQRRGFPVVVKGLSPIVAHKSEVGGMREYADRLVELEINPLLVLPDRVVAVDALIRLVSPDAATSSALPKLHTEEVG